MKSVMISIKPKWCELIASGQKTIEVRKTKPKIKPPFKCYIYKTVNGQTNAVDMFENNLGKVIGEFICDGFYTMKHCGYDNRDVKLRLVDEDLHYLEIDSDFLNKCRLSHYDIEKYSNGRDVYGWHISDLKIYDFPLSVDAFEAEGDCKANDKDCSKCRYNGGFECLYISKGSTHPIIRPPQSWCYVEEIEI